jgi:simple sugar transport system permease protein
MSVMRRKKMVKALSVRLARLHIQQRGELTRVRTALYRAAAIAGALITGGVFLWTMGQNPFSVYATLIRGALGTVSMQKETIKMMIPLCVTSLGVALAFRMRFWNIGGEGQICVGAICASYFAYFHNTLPQWALILIMAAAAMAGAGLWGMIPALFKVRFGTNETLFTLMLNYIVLYFIQYLKEGPWRDGTMGGFASMPRFTANARLPEAPVPFVGGVHIGWIVMLALVSFLYIYIRHTKQGYELTVVGENMNTARYAGMPVNRIILRTMFISAALCGLAGMLQVAGPDRQLSEQIANGRGFTAISVAWLSRLSPAAVMAVSFLFAVMQKGSSVIQTQYNIPSAMADILQGIILFFVLGSEFFIRYRLAAYKEAE